MMNVAVATLIAGLVLASSLAQAASQAAEDDIFHSTNLLRISIEIPAEGMRALRQSQSGRNGQPKTKTQATVVEGGRVYTNATVQLKGFTTFQPIDGLPSLTLNFDSAASKQKFHGLEKISLNNSLQDATRLHEKLSRELFAAAGVPVPQADYAVVTLNGRELGLYVLAEGFDKEFLRRHFQRTDGNFYEGGILRDIDQPLQLSPGKNPTNHSGVQRLISASREPDADRRWRALEAALDMDRFLSMMAMETILCHSDSYSMNRNNYRLYHDPATDKMVFMPHGMDRVLGTHRSPLELPVVPPSLGLVARAVLSTPEGCRRHVERVGVLFTNIFQPDRLCRRVLEIDARIISAKTNRPTEQWFDQRPGREAAHDAENLCERISRRAAELRLQFQHVAELIAPVPNARFDSNGLARLEAWKPKLRLGQPEIMCEAEVQDGQPILHLRAPNGPLTAALHATVNVPLGNYRLRGQLKVIGAADATNFVSTTMLRYSTGRFDITRQHLNSWAIDFPFGVSEARTPDEIEFICEIRSDASEVWFDANSLRLVRERR